MKKLVAIICACTILLSCKKEETKPTTIQTTSLKITVLNGSGNSVKNATVKLYNSESDYYNSQNQLGTTKYTNDNGEVEFDNLTNTKYYWDIEKDCANNVNTSHTTVSPLTLNKINTVNTIVQENGDLKFVNTTSDTYKVYLDGIELGDISGNSIDYQDYVELGKHTIRVIQQDGYIISPTDETITITVSCGTNTINI